MIIRVILDLSNRMIDIAIYFMPLVSPPRKYFIITDITDFSTEYNVPAAWWSQLHIILNFYFSSLQCNAHRLL